MAHRRKISWHKQKPTPGSQPDPAHPSRYRLALDLPFLEGAGLRAKDYSAGAAGGNDGTLTGGVTWGVGKFGKCPSFPGAATNYVDIGAAFTLPVPYTIIVSGYLTATNANWELLFGKSSAVGFWVDSTLKMQFASINGFSSGVVASLNSWHHYAVTVDNAGNNRMYFDGSQVATSALTTFGTLAGWRYFGAGPLAGNGIWTGLLDSPKVYPFAATPAFIVADYTSPWAGWSPTPARRRMQASASTANFRRTLSNFGTRAGKRQPQGVGV